MNTTPTIYTDDAGALVRHLLTYAAGALVMHGLLAGGQTAQFVEIGTSVLMYVGGQGWSLWQKHRAKQLLNVALASPAVRTEAQATAAVAAGSAPSVLTPPTTVPIAAPAPQGL